MPEPVTTEQLQELARLEKIKANQKAENRMGILSRVLSGSFIPDLFGGESPEPEPMSLVPPHHRERFDPIPPELPPLADDELPDHGMVKVAEHRATSRDRAERHLRSLHGAVKTLSIPITLGKRMIGIPEFSEGDEEFVSSKDLAMGPVHMIQNTARRLITALGPEGQKFIEKATGKPANYETLLAEVDADPFGVGLETLATLAPLAHMIPKTTIRGAGPAAPRLPNPVIGDKVLAPSTKPVVRPTSKVGVETDVARPIQLGDGGHVPVEMDLTAPVKIGDKVLAEPGTAKVKLPSLSEDVAIINAATEAVTSMETAVGKVVANNATAKPRIKVPVEQMKKAMEADLLETGVPVTEAPKVAAQMPVPTDRFIGISHAEGAKLLEGLNLQHLSPQAKAGWVENVNRAILDGYPERALKVAQEILAPENARIGRVLTQKEAAGTLVKVTEIERNIREVLAELEGPAQKAWDAHIQAGRKMEGISPADNARLRLSGLEAQKTLLIDASNFAGSETARIFNFRKAMMSLEDLSIKAVLRKAEAIKGKELDTVQKKGLQQAVRNMEEAQAKADNLFKDFDARVAQEAARLAEERVREIMAKEKVADLKASNRGARKRNILAERNQIKKELSDLGFRMNDITGLGPETSYLIGRLAINYIKDGIHTLGGVVSKIRSEYPDITVRDIWEGLNARNPKATEKGPSVISRIKKEARLKADIEDVQAGRSPKDRSRTRGEETPEIEALKKRLAVVKKEKVLLDAQQGKFAEKGKRLSLEPEIEKLNQQIHDLRVAHELRIRLGNARRGIFEEPRTRRKGSPEVEAMRRELQILQARRNIHRKRVLRMIEEARNPTVTSQIREGLNLMRTLKATFDMSVTLRQGLLLIPGRGPRTTGRAFVNAAKSAFNETTAEILDAQMREMPSHYLRERAKLYLPEIRDVALSGREELFMSNWAERIPGYGKIVQMSERHMIAFLNEMRAAAFDQFLEWNPKATSIQQAAWADYVNVASGRGNLGKLGRSAEYLSTIFFAPKFATSRIEYPFLALKQVVKGNRSVARQIASEQVKVAATGAAALVLAKMGGAEVNLDPRSSDFLKAKVGNTRIDPWGGIQQPSRLILRAFFVPPLEATGVIRGKKRTGRPKGPVTLTEEFVGFKLAPWLQLVEESFTGVNVVGEKRTFLPHISLKKSLRENVDALGESTVVRAPFPIFIEDVFDAWQDLGLDPKLAPFAVGSFLGMGINTHQAKGSGRRR